MRHGDGWLRDRWRTVAVFGLLAPGLFMLVDMSAEQMSQEAGFSFARLWSWIADERFFVVRTVYLLGLLPALFAGLLVARRDAKGGATLLFALVLSILLGLPVALFLAEFYIFTPPSLDEQLSTGGRALASVVVSGLICYAVSRWMARGKR
jgi:hypothetical protein